MIEDDGAIPIPSVRVIHNPDDGSLEVRLAGPVLTLEGLSSGVEFERMTADGEAALALWLDPAEAAVLAKMIRYILESVKITEGSKNTLEAVLPRVEALVVES